QPALRKNRGPVLLRAFRGFIPPRFEECQLRFEESQLLSFQSARPFLLPKEDRLEQGFCQRVTFVGNRDGYTELFPDARCLAQNDLQDGAVYRVVGSIEKRGPDDLARLTEAVHAAFALFMA